MTTRASGTLGGAALQIRDALAGAAEQLARSTVQISTVRGRGGDRVGPGSDQGRDGVGSGVIWRADGLVVTNAHVVRDARRVLVELTDGRRFRGEVVRLDAQRDLAAIRLEGAMAETSPIVAAEVASARELRVGQLVFALGHPWGVRNTMTTGIVHAVPGATTGLGRGARRWLQADVRLAPGNSGGPLADAWGRVVGVNSMIVRGLAFAVPSDVVERFLAAGSMGGSLGGVAAA